MERINGVIKEGRVYVTYSEYVHCPKYDFSLMCIDFMEKYGNSVS